jgi:urease accessory protein UreF
VHQQLHDEELLQEWAAALLDQQIADGYAPRHPRAWLRTTRDDLARRCSPEYVQRAVAGIRARRQGRSLTGWREVRGSHAISHVADPFGTDRPPWL